MGEPAAQHLPGLIGRQNIRRPIYLDGALQRIRFRIERDREREGVRSSFDDHDVAAHAVRLFERGVLAVELVDIGIVEHGAVLRRNAAFLFERAVGKQELVACGERPRLHPGAGAVRLVIGDLEHFISRILQRLDVCAPVGAREYGFGARLRRRIAVDVPGIGRTIHRDSGRVAVAHDRDGTDVGILRVRRERQRIIAAHVDGDIHLPVAKSRAGSAHVLVFNQILPAARTAAAGIVRIPDAIFVLNAELELVAHVQVDRDRKFVLASRLGENVAVLPLDGSAVPADRGERTARRRTARNQPLAGVLGSRAPQGIDIGVPRNGGIKAPVKGEICRCIPTAECIALFFIVHIRRLERFDSFAFLHFPGRDDRTSVIECDRVRLRLRRWFRLLRTCRRNAERQRHQHCRCHTETQFFQFRLCHTTLLLILIMLCDLLNRLNKLYHSFSLCQYLWEKFFEIY